MFKKLFTLKYFITFLMVIAFLFPVASYAQSNIVTSAYHVAWDNGAEPGIVTGSKLYLSRDETFVPGAETLVATIPGDGGGNGATILWPIVAASGTWYCKVSFTFMDVDNEEAETGFAGPINFYVIPDPQNPRILTPQEIASRLLDARVGLGI